jgi:hypothetical protein
MLVNFKITAWESINVPVELENEVLAELENETIRTSKDLVSLLKQLNNNVSAELVPVFDSQCQMTLNENQGYPTIVAQIEDQPFPIWTNS